MGAGTHREGALRIERPVTLEAAPGTRPVLTGADPAKEGMAAHPEQLWVDGEALRQVATRDEVTAGTLYVDDPHPVTRGTAADGSTVYEPRPRTGTRYVIGTDPDGHDVEIAEPARAGR